MENKKGEGEGVQKNFARAPEEQGYYHCCCTNIAYTKQTDCEKAGYEWECDPIDP